MKKNNSTNSNVTSMVATVSTAVAGVENSNLTPTIEREVRSIFDALTLKAADNMVVTLDRPRRGESNRGTIKVFRRADVDRQRAEEIALRNFIREGGNPRDVAKPRRAVPVMVYVFYPSIYDNRRLGSVAIYGSDAGMMGSWLKRSRSLFGRTVLSTTFEHGIEPFVSVKFAA
ncbi:MAG: hypothetical protein J1E63_06320 [Muribaculaceae bacterium]|nr:hypothetical protein [Muribaculaceae bacterium]